MEKLFPWRCWITGAKTLVWEGESVFVISEEPGLAGGCIGKVSTGRRASFALERAPSGGQSGHWKRSEQGDLSG